MTARRPAVWRGSGKSWLGLYRPGTGRALQVVTAVQVGGRGVPGGVMAGVTVFRWLSRRRGVSFIFPKEDTMPSANRMSTAIAVDEAQIEGRYAVLGGYTVSFETFKQDADPAPYFAGLPGDRCQCAHWGVVTAGQLTFRWPDHDETYVAGDAYYAPPGHLPLVTAGTATVEFSPTAELEATMAVVQKNLTGSEVSA